ncbi:MAG: PLD nuclease N-terminal domain-containing protein [Actinomycetota bacterium]
MTAGEGTLLLVFVVIPIVVLWIAAILHIVFRRPDLSPVHKAIWIGIVLIVPTIGVLVYVLLRPAPSLRWSKGDDPTVSGAAIDEVHGLIALHDSGTIGDEEFGRRKAEVFGLI